MLQKIITIILLVFCSTLVSSNSNDGEKVRYDNYKIYEIQPGNKTHVEILKDLSILSDSLIFLEDSIVSGKSTHVIVAPHKHADFLEVLTAAGIKHELKENNLQNEIDKEITPFTMLISNNGYDWNTYHTLDETYNWLKSLTKKYPKNVKLLKGGKTHEKRDILGVKISFGKGKKGIFIEGGIHAREWISPATVTYILNQVLTNKNKNVRAIVENYDWYIFPHFNPDGYVYTHTKNRLWRKTRSKQSSSCTGVDPNRNWDFHWNEVNPQSSACSETYAGPKKFSEIEMKTLSEFIKSLKGKIHTYIAFHSYSQLLLFPYAHTSTKAKNHKDLLEIGNVAVKALSKRYGTKYVVGDTYHTIYPASGSSGEWAYGVAKIPLSYTYELRPARVKWNGFVLPPEQILPTGEETFDSILALVKHAKKLGYL